MLVVPSHRRGTGFKHPDPRIHEGPASRGLRFSWLGKPNIHRISSAQPVIARG